MKARIPQSAGGGSMANMLKQAQKMQQDAAELQQQLDEREYSATSGGDMVQVTVTGKHQITALTIRPEAIEDAAEDPEFLADMIIAAVNHAMQEADDTAAAEMEKLTGAMNLPNIPGMGGLF